MAATLGPKLRLAGASYHRVEKIAGQAGLILLGVIVAGLITTRLPRRFAARSPGGPYGHR